jgi:hypothetical protein
MVKKTPAAEDGRDEPAAVVSDAEFLEAVRIVRAAVRRRGVPERFAEDAQSVAVLYLAECRTKYRPGVVPFKNVYTDTAVKRAVQFLKRERRQGCQDACVAQATTRVPRGLTLAGTGWAEVLPLLDRLAERQRLALDLRLGLTGRRHKLREVAARTGCRTVQRVQSLVRQAAANLAYLLRHPHLADAAAVEHARRVETARKAVRSRRVPVWSEAELARAAQMRAAGQSTTAIGRQLGRTPQAVQCALGRLGVRCKKAWSEADLARAFALRAEGLTCAQIGQRLGRHEYAVRTKLHRQTKRTS